jgi:hypothetical protein
MTKKEISPWGIKMGFFEEGHKCGFLEGFFSGVGFILASQVIYNSVLKSRLWSNRASLN